MKSNLKYKMNMKNFNKLCRLCLSEYVLSKSKDLFQKKIQEMIQFCSSIIIKEEAGLPSRICSSCCQNLIRFYSFRRKIERIDRILKKHSRNKVSKQDILNIALNDADIVRDANEGISICGNKSLVDLNDFSLENNFEAPNNSSTDSLMNEQDLSVERNNDNGVESMEITRNTRSRKTKENAMKIIQSIINDAETNEEVSNTQNMIVEFPLNGEKLEQTPTILQGEPPPLIPIKPIPDKQILSNTHILFECTKCNEKFATSTLLNEHSSKCFLSSLVCNICKKEFKERNKLIGHLKGHMVAKNYGCKICGKRYPNPSTFEIHMRTHTGERPFKCPVCSKGFARWAGVVSHMQTHYDHRPYKCETCNKSFKIVSNLERHKVLHAEIMPFCCNYCGKTFSQSDNLQLHIRSYHTNERPYLCSQCGKGFVSSTRLNRHMWVHTGHKPFRCSLCPKAYSNSSDLKNHERGVHGNGDNEKPFACTLCEMRFFHPCRLSKHLKTHQRPFACSHCNKSFSSNSLLEKHTELSHADKDEESTNLY